MKKIVLVIGFCLLPILWLAGAVLQPSYLTQTQGELWNLAHAPMFGILTVLLAHLFKNRFGCPKYATILAVGSAFTLGIVQELVQLFGPRDADIQDIVTNCIGIALGAGAWWVWQELQTLRQLRDQKEQIALWDAQHRRFRGLLLIYLVIAIVLCGYLLLPWWQTFQDQLDRDAAAPIVWDPASGWGHRFRLNWWADTRVQSAPSPPFKASSVLEWKAWSGSGPRVGIFEAHPHWDQERYQVIVLEISNQQSEAVPLFFRVNDLWHNDEPEDRYEVQFWVQPGYQRVRFPLDEIAAAPVGRPMDFSAITEVFIHKPKSTAEGQTFLLGLWWLE